MGRAPASAHMPRLQGSGRVCDPDHLSRWPDHLENALPRPCRRNLDAQSLDAGSSDGDANTGAKTLAGTGEVKRFMKVPTR